MDMDLPGSISWKNSLTMTSRRFILHVNENDCMELCMAKTVTLRLDEKTYRNFKRCAKARNRSLANFIETAALRHIEETLHVDEEERAEILADEVLKAKLKQGSHAARRREGRFVA